jgi:hypothetical protein
MGSMEAIARAAGVATPVPELYDVTAGRIELRNDALQPSGRIMKAGRKLEEQTADAGAEQVGNASEIADERLRLGKRLTWVMSSE